MLWGASEVHFKEIALFSLCEQSDPLFTLYAS